MIMLLQYVMADLEVQVRDVVFFKKTTSLIAFCGVPICIFLYVSDILFLRI